MLDLSKLPVQATLGILSRHTVARVNLCYSVWSEKICATTFNARRRDGGNVKAVVTSSLGDTLEFGFGIEDVV